MHFLHKLEGEILLSGDSLMSCDGIIGLMTKKIKKKIKKEINNYAFIDGQNLYMGTKETNPKWTIDAKKLRVFLTEKYRVSKAYYYLGCLDEDLEPLYTALQEAGFILVFREHHMGMTGKKKGNVDVEIVFAIMKKLYEREKFDKVVLISGDGDYIRMVRFLIEIDKFEKILFPNIKFASSLYKSLRSHYFDHLGKKENKEKLILQKKSKKKGT